MPFGNCHSLAWSRTEETGDQPEQPRPSGDQPDRQTFRCRTPGLCVFRMLTVLRSRLAALAACAVLAANAGLLAAGPSRAADLPEFTLETMIGQMIMVGFVGTGTGDPWTTKLAGQIASGQVGGVLFLKRNVVDRDQVKALTAAFQAAGGTRPVLLAIDQEGGIVQRLTAAAGFEERPSARDVARSQTVAEATATYAGLARDLRDWGFNLNLGPVVDVDVNPENPIIGALGRSFSGDPDVVAAYAAAFVTGHRAEGVLTSLKHFPGHGSSRDDSHKGFVDITRTWTPAELKPYRSLIAAGLADTVMPGHLYLEMLSEPGGWLPTSLSKPAMDMLRDDLGFEGVIVSDDMEMQAIEADYTLEEAAVAAVRAGASILIYSNYAHQRPDLPEQVIAILMRRAEQDAELRGRIEESYRRIMTLKAGLGAAAPSPR
jgi:beta-N-acetylhexosaminidase